MPGDSADPPRVQRKPDWLDESTYRAMEQSFYRQAAFGKDAQQMKAAVREVALAHYPAAPMPLIEEAVACVVPDPQGPAAFSPEWYGEPLRQATDEEVVGSLSYALRFDERGKPRRTGSDFLAGLAASQLAQHMKLSLFVVMKRPPRKQHTAGGNT